MFDPIKASQEIGQSYIDYIQTTFDLADKEYSKEFKSELSKEGMVAKGPFLDIGGSYETGKTLQDLIADGKVNPLFAELEPAPEAKKELKLERPLYTHQESALLKARSGQNLVVTSGTGSGKTECFLLPIIDHLLSEQTTGTLNTGVRAIIIYPMNALANDQMKRMRAILKGYPKITYGVYNGNTRHTHSAALSDYHQTYKDQHGNPLEPMPNEIISREEMQKTPPHILITNYSMLEYMMLRPKDDAVFSGVKLRYIVLDEAHIYKGATGIETSMLMRRLRARISNPDSVQYILTSATLGGPKSDNEILNFARKLCGVSFEASGIIRATEKRPPMLSRLNFPPEIFVELNNNRNQVSEILAKYNADFAPDMPTEEKLYSFFLHSSIFNELRKCATHPITVSELKKELYKVTAITDEQVVALIEVCARASHDGASLIKPRYHFFVRAIEGAYITLADPKKLFLQRKTEFHDKGKDDDLIVFEAAVCTDCGRIAVVGKVENGFLRQHSSLRSGDSSDLYYIMQNQDGELLDDEDDDQTDQENDYVLCSKCGAISTEADTHFQLLCEHSKFYQVRVKKVRKNSSGEGICPACGFGHFRRFYVGADAATAVLGAELFEELPDEEVVVTQNSSVNRQSIFTRNVRQRRIRKKKIRQFLCFSDSRNEAAFFATYMERYYQEFLRRRGIWHVAGGFRVAGRTKVSVAEFVDELIRYFDDKKSFVEWDAREGQDPGLIRSRSKSNAWIAILNEMFGSRRSTSLVSMGVLSFEYRKNEEVFHGLQDEYHLTASDARALLELLVWDVVLAGAIDAGNVYRLSQAEREYIFFSPYQRRMVLLKTGEKKSNLLTGWMARIRLNGNYYSNKRLILLTRTLGVSEEEANKILKDYWDNVFEVETEEFVLDANEFDIRIGGLPDTKFYRCKKCGRVTPFNVQNRCASVKCSGTLEEYEPLNHIGSNHFAKLYQSDESQPLYIKEHTAQLSRDQQTTYQEAFVQKKINALSCSTTFELGVDVGSLETVYMRDVPPSPANYVQRAGRAGRASNSVAFVLTYARLSSHDFTYYKDPRYMISGMIKAPVFEIENEKIIYRHIFAVAIGSFLYAHSEVYDGDNQTVLLNEGGYELLKEYLETKPENLRILLLRSIPNEMHDRLGISDFSWVDHLCGDEGVLEIAVADFRATVDEMIKQIKQSRRIHDDESAGAWSRSLRFFRCGREDNAGKKSLISFLVRNNVLPKYGFPVDTVELYPNMESYNREKGYGQGNELQLVRDLQMAIADYAPGAQVVADGKMYTSRYIRRAPGKNAESSWEMGYYCPSCPNCGQPNFTKDPIVTSSRECVSCHTPIPRRRWMRTLEPRMGFTAEQDVDDVPMHRPEHDYKTDAYYIGDPHKHTINKLSFSVNGNVVQIESTSNDSLVVVGQTDYYVCPVCGYANETSIPLKHKNERGYICSNKEGKGKRFRLSHDFKTDVARITFACAEAADYNIMLSVLFALLEGMSREMGIERTDINGCLFGTYVNRDFVFSVVLYDTVAGGAGHVRRIVTEDGIAFRRVIERAISVVDNCDCDSSCYNCLRNYYNQKIHDNLDRKLASSFLHEWLGEMVKIEIEEVKTEDQG